MHKFLRAIGFSNITKAEFKELTKQMMDKPEVLKVTRDSEGNEFAQLLVLFGKGIGISLCGILREDESFEMEYYFPYLEGTEVSTEEDIEIEKHSDKEAYAGVCDEIRIGVTLIFYLQNVADHLSVQLLEKSENAEYNGAKLSALSCDAKIIMPATRHRKKVPDTNSQIKERNQLMAEAMEGDESAMEDLTLRDMDTYSIISKRLENEDVLSIVDTYFMPYGIESDQYSILAEIQNVRLEKNYVTNEEIYCMKVLCNDIIIEVCINQKDLLGVPDIGRRFKGNIWLQGSVLI